MSNVEFLGIREQISNPGFDPVEFDGIRKQAALHAESSRVLGRIRGLL